MAIHGHYLRGGLGGFVLGLALTIMLTLYGVLPLGSIAGLWVLLGTTAFGLVWAKVAPAPRSEHKGSPAAQ